MFQNLSEVITICKQNMGVRDLPKPVSDQDLRWRLEHSALKSFSQCYPYMARFMIGESERLCKPYVGVPTNHRNSYSNVYQIPKHYYQENSIFSVTDMQISRPNGYNDLYVPQGMVGDPASILVGLSSMQAVGAMARQMTHSLTWDFKSPDIIILYNGWTGGNYEIELAMSHDPSLSTIPPGAATSFLELCQYDLEEYLYMTLKRVQNLDLGIGSIELKIDDWADSGNKKKELLASWTESAVFDTEHIMYW